MNIYDLAPDQYDALRRMREDQLAQQDPQSDQEAYIRQLLGDEPSTAPTPLNVQQPSRFEQILEGLQGVNFGPQRGAGASFLSGLVGGLGSSAGARAKVRETSNEMARRLAAAKDAQNLAASQRYKSDRGRLLGDLAKEKRGAAADIAKEERDATRAGIKALPLTPEMVKQMPHLGRVPLGTPIPVSELIRPDAKPDKPFSEKLAEETALAEARAKASAQYGTEAQKGEKFQKRAGFAVQGVTKPDKAGSSIEDRIANSGTFSQYGLRGPYALQNKDQKAYTQAIKQFALSWLRQETGAAISDQETENTALAYFAQPGDGPDEVARKRAARQLAIEAMKAGTTGTITPEGFLTDDGRLLVPEGTPQQEFKPLPPTWKVLSQ